MGNTKKKRWERLGISEPRMQQWCDSAMKYFQKMERCVKLSYDVGADDDNRHMRILDCLGIIQLTFFEWKETVASPKVVLGYGVRVVTDYFFGSWRLEAWHESGKQFSETQCRKKIPWATELRLGLVFSTLLGDEISLRKIARYVGPDLKDDDGLGTFTEADVAFYRTLSSFVIEGNLELSQKHIAKIAGSGRKRAKYLASCLEAIAVQDARAFESQMAKLLTIYRQIDFEPRQPYPSLDGTLLWNFALMNGMRISELDQQFMDFVMTRSTLNLS